MALDLLLIGIGGFVSSALCVGVSVFLLRKGKVKVPRPITNAGANGLHVFKDFIASHSELEAEVPERTLANVAEDLRKESATS